MAPDSIGKGILLKADSIASAFRDEIKTAISQSSRPPKLVGILATSSAPSKFYAEFTKKQCDELGVEFVLKKIGAAADPSLNEGEGVEEAIIEANDDDSVNGIMVGTISFKRMNCCTDNVNKGVLPHLRSAAGLYHVPVRYTKLRLLAGSLSPASKRLERMGLHVILR